MMPRRLQELLRSERLPEMLYYVSLTGWLFVTVVFTSFFAAYIPYRLVRHVLLALLVLSELAKGSWSRRSIAALGLAGLVLCANFGSSYTSLIDVAVYAVVGRSFDQKKTARICLVTLLAALAFVIACGDLGIIENKVEGGKRIREFIGFTYSLYPAQYGFAAVCLLAYVRSERFSLSDLLFSVGLNLYLYARTLSRLSMLLSVAMAVGMLVLAFASRRLRGRHLRIVRWAKVLGIAAVSATVLCAIVTIVITVAYEPTVSWMAKLDSQSVLSGRLRYGQDAIRRYGLSLFGQHLDLVGNGLNPDGSRNISGPYNWIDSMYIKMLVEDGLIVFVTFLALSTLVGWHAWKTRDIGLMVAVVACAGHGMIDQLCFSLQFNPLLLLAGLPFADVGGLEVTMPRLARRLPGEGEERMPLGASLAFVARGWRIAVVSAVTCLALVTVWCSLVPVSYRVQAKLQVADGKEVAVQSLAYHVLTVVDMGDIWLTAGANDAAGAVFVAAQGADAARCEDFVVRTLELMRLYATRSASTKKTQTKIVPPDGAEEIRPHTRAMQIAAAGTGLCGAVIWTVMCPMREREGRRDDG